MTELISRLDPSRFALHVACFRRQGLWLPKVERAASELREFPLSSLYGPATLREMLRFARWCRARQLRVVHTCDFYANVFGLPGAALAGVPLRIGSRRDLVLPGRGAAKHALQRLAYRAAHRVVANSKAAADQVAHEGIARERVVMIPNGIDLERYAPAPPRSTRRIVTTVANLRAEKGHDVLIAAAALVHARRPDAIFQLVGGGPMREALEQQARASGLGDVVRFLGHREDVPEVLHGSDVYVLPSRSEAFPNGVVEAMAAGLPVVASNVGGIPELITDEQNGLLAPVGDANALADAILRLLGAPAEAATLAAAARRTIERGYSFDRMVRAFEALYLGGGAAALSSRLPIPSQARG